MKSIKTLLLLSLLTLCGCFGLWDSGSDTITGDYTIMWIDVLENQSVCRKIEGSAGSHAVIVPEYVYAVGHNDNYIIAKQHPTDGFEGGFEINTAITNYYIINMETEKVSGPLTKEEFKQLRKELRISRIKFDQIYPERP